MRTAVAIIARQLLSTLGLAFVDTRAPRITLCAVIIGLDIHLYQVLCRSNLWDALAYILAATLAALTISTSYFLALTPNPRKTFRLRGSADPKTMSEKLFWSIRVHFSPRLIGFENQATKIPRAPPIRRQEFIAQQLRHVVLETMIAGAAWSIVAWFDLFDFIHPVEGRLPNLTQEVTRCLCATALSFYTALWFLNTSYQMFSILSVGTGSTGPDEWPPFFGPIVECTTLAKSWG